MSERISIQPEALKKPEVRVNLGQLLVEPLSLNDSILARLPSRNPQVNNMINFLAAIS